MSDNEIIEKFVNAVKKFETGLVYDITVEDFGTGFYDGEEYLTCELSYQIDDRVERLDSEIKESLTEEFENEFDVDISREDAYPNGYAFYKINFSKGE